MEIKSDQWYTSSELAIAGFSLGSLHAAHARGDLPASKQGYDRYAFLGRDLLAFLESSVVASSETAGGGGGGMLTITPAKTKHTKPTKSQEPSPMSLSDFPPGFDAEAAFEKAVAAEMKEQGIPRHAAVRAVFSRHPQLRAAYVEQMNQTMPNTRRPSATAPAATATIPEPRRVASGTAETQYRSAIREAMARGLSKAEATARVCREQPELRDQFLDEHNASARRR